MSGIELQLATLGQGGVTGLFLPLQRGSIFFGVDIELKESFFVELGILGNSGSRTCIYCRNYHFAFKLGTGISLFCASSFGFGLLASDIGLVLQLGFGAGGFFGLLTRLGLGLTLRLLSCPHQKTAERPRGEATATNHFDG